MQKKKADEASEKMISYQYSGLISMLLTGIIVALNEDEIKIIRARIYRKLKICLISNDLY